MKTSGIEYYAMTRGRWNWRCRAANGRIVAQGEPNGFADQRGAFRAHRTAIAAMMDAKRARIIEAGEK